MTYYGVDNQIDGIVLDVLIRRHKAIRSSLGVSVPVPANTNQVIEAVIEGLLLRGRKAAAEHQAFLPFGDFEAQKETLFSEWEAAADREKRSRTMFAQETIKPEEVLPELQAVRVGDRLGRRRGAVHAGRAPPSPGRRHRRRRGADPDRPRRSAPRPPRADRRPGRRPPRPVRAAGPRGSGVPESHPPRRSKRWRPT